MTRARKPPTPIASPRSVLSAKSALAELKRLGDRDDALFLQRYFRTAPGEYGAGDRFLGVRVPQTRQLARRYRELSLSQSTDLLHSRWHEARLLALLILVEQHRRGDARQRATIHSLYLGNTRYVNNWDLVDLSAKHLVGPYIETNAGLLDTLAGSSSLWERRIAVLATAHTVDRDVFGPTLSIAARLLDDEHDLIHKAVGWMLREVGNRDREQEERFLRKHYRTMPRTMLRYAIERFPEPLRQRYLRGTVEP